MSSCAVLRAENEAAAAIGMATGTDLRTVREQESR